MKNLISGAEFWNFEKHPVFIGAYTGEQTKREKDAEGSDTDMNKKAGAVMGYNFGDLNGEVQLIGNSYLIAKALEKVTAGSWVRIEFTGKAKNAKGQPVNKYKVDLFDDENEARAEYENLASHDTPVS